MEFREVSAALDTLHGALDALDALRPETLTYPEQLAVLDRLEQLRCRQPALENRLLARLCAEASPIALGAKNLPTVLATRLRLSAREAHRRIDEAIDLGPRTALNGEPLAPTLTATATAQTRGQINTDHIAIIREFATALPAAVDYQTREQAEATLAAIAAGQRPEALRTAAHRLMALLHPDGELSDDAERARRRYLSIGKQGADGMSKLTGLLDPQARATLEAVLAKLAGPGMCNPDDPAPVVDGAPGDEQAHHDRRTPGQRNHDALTAMGRAVLASGQLGQLNGLPVTLIVSTTLQDLRTAAGHAVTGGGTLLPMRDVIRLASHAHHYLAVFDKHTGQALYLGRTKRIASPAQRIVLHARDRGCTHPGCTTPGYFCQVHHINGWATSGQTNIDELTLACAPDNRLVETSDWSTHTGADGTTEWIPPPHLDTGQTRTNPYHHPERLLNPEPDEPDEPDEPEKD